jgi:signal transduction histidine kinase
VHDGRADDLRGFPVATAVDAHTAVWTPLRFRGELLGVLTVFGDLPFTDEDERLLAAFGASAASAIATAQNAARRALRLSIQAAEEERRRWARELHDQTLQELGGLRMLLNSGRRRGGEGLVESVDEAVELLGDAISELRHLITELRPAALDQIGVAAALETLAGRMARQHGLRVDLDIDLAYESGREPTRHTPDLEAALYRVTQEALTNVARHSGSDWAQVTLTRTGPDRVTLAVVDRGRGLPPGAASGGGMQGMAERASAVEAALSVSNRNGGSSGAEIRLDVPLQKEGLWYR